MKRFELFLAFICCALSVSAQNMRRVEGEVKDYMGASVPNATLQVYGVNKEYRTDANGKFSIDVPIHAFAITVFSEGYKAKFMEIDGTYMLFILRPGFTKEKKVRIVAEKVTAAIKRREEYKEYRGYRQLVDLSYSYCGVTDFLGVNYIGGYRFNPYIFLGLGTGMNIALFTPDASKLDLSFCKPSVVNIPVYIHLKTNFTKTNWSPYISLSAGGRISTKTYENTRFIYNQSGFLGGVKFGIDRVISKKLSLYFGVGYRIESYLYCKFESNDELIQGHKLLHGFSAHLGLSF